MKHAQFDYVNQFHCLAGDCPDTCCKDWQIILDEDALARIIMERIDASVSRKGAVFA